MFFLILTLAGSLLHAYCAWRIGALPWIRRRIGGRRWWFSAALLWLVYLSGIAIGDNPAGLIAAAVAQFAFHWLVVLFLLSLCLLAVDALTGFGLLWPRRAAPLRVGAVAVAALLVTVALVQGLRAPVVTRYQVVMPGLPAALDGTSVVALSDLHLGASAGSVWLAARVAQTEALHPDLIVLSGDLVEGEPKAIPGLADALRRLHAPLGVWAVTGNHELYGDTPATTKLFESAGIHWLRDRVVTLRPGLRLAGVDYLDGRGRGRGLSPEQLAALAGRGQEAAILVSHAPSQAGAAARAGFGLMLSGHTHGGQVWPFGYLVRLRYPYFSGRYRVGRMTLIVGVGTGSWAARMRLWRPGQILQVTLRAPPAAARHEARQAPQNGE